MRSGIVSIKSSNETYFGITTEDDFLTVIEILDNCSIEIGDIIAWKSDYGLGGEKYVNKTKNEMFDVYVQDHGVLIENFKRIYVE